MILFLLYIFGEFFGDSIVELGGVISLVKFKFCWFWALCVLMVVCCDVILFLLCIFSEVFVKFVEVVKVIKFMKWKICWFII